ncbi:solute carrier family 39 (zinc transporter), member 1/2/3 [Strigomonas culicis]|nr:solute carrier family 39 (zinc transporter), member 1/2/3 [Strigomonas culicis]|eukprot:EPY24320.1 solute carrier family 39 (zinc transporter), member 1/2/3 [Strigomonas culicis]
MVHLLQDAVEDFDEDCVPASFTESYSGYGFMFCIVSALLMHAMDYYLAEVTERWADRKRADRELKQREEAQLKLEAKAAGLDGDACAPADPEALMDDVEVAELAGSHEPTCPDHPNCGHAHGQMVPGGDAEKDVPHGHSHAFEMPDDKSQLRRIIAAICMEFGVTLHSVFVGLALALNSDAELKPLLIAIVFHQLFEGMSLGSRLVDAKFRVALDIILALIFSISAPLGMVAATIAVNVRPDAMSGPAFVMMLAILNSFCAGILLYLAFNLLFIDFTADVKLFSAPTIHPLHMRYEKDPTDNVNRHPKAKKVILFVALWMGMGLMALVGKWL